MNSIENWESIDYNDILDDISEDLDSGMLTPDTELYILRQNGKVKITGTDLVVSPVLDFFYNDPELEPNLRKMTILDLKKICYEAKEHIDNVANQNLKEVLATTLDLLITEMSSYTKNNSKRNNEPCKVVFTKETEKCISCPLIFFYEENDCCDEIEIIKTSVLLDELKKCSKND